jgi:hypothetical protein
MNATSPTATLTADHFDGIAVINAIKANIPLCPFAKAFGVPHFRRSKSEDAPEVNSAGKGFRLVYPVQPEVGTHQISPLFVIQLRFLEKFSTRHRRVDPKIVN